MKKDMAAPAGPWRKLHRAIDAGNGEIVANTLTDNGADDVGEVPCLLGQVEGEIISFIADGAYEIDGYLRSQSARGS
jgi:hypothetical protein